MGTCSSSVGCDETSPRCGVGVVEFDWARYDVPIQRQPTQTRTIKVNAKQQEQQHQHSISRPHSRSHSRSFPHSPMASLPPSTQRDDRSAACSPPAVSASPPNEQQNTQNKQTSQKRRKKHRAAHQSNESIDYNANPSRLSKFSSSFRGCSSPDRYLQQEPMTSAAPAAIQSRVKSHDFASSAHDFMIHTYSHDEPSITSSHPDAFLQSRGVSPSPNYNSNVFSFDASPSNTSNNIRSKFAAHIRNRSHNLNEPSHNTHPLSIITHLNKRLFAGAIAPPSTVVSPLPSSRDMFHTHSTQQHHAQLNTARESQIQSSRIHSTKPSYIEIQPNPSSRSQANSALPTPTSSQQKQSTFIFINTNKNKLNITTQEYANNKNVVHQEIPCCIKTNIYDDNDVDYQVYVKKWNELQQCELDKLNKYERSCEIARLKGEDVDECGEEISLFYGNTNKVYSYPTDSSSLLQLKHLNLQDQLLSPPSSTHPSAPVTPSNATEEQHTVNHSALTIPITSSMSFALSPSPSPCWSNSINSNSPANSTGFNNSMSVLQFIRELSSHNANNVLSTPKHIYHSNGLVQISP